MKGNDELWLNTAELAKLTGWDADKIIDLLNLPKDSKKEIEEAIQEGKN